MDGETFDDLVKRLAAARLTRWEALRGVLASAAVGLAGAALADTQTDAKKKAKGAGKKKHQGKRAHGKRKRNGMHAHGEGKGKRKHQGKRKGKTAHGQAQPACPNGRCDLNTSRCGTACVCVGTGSKSRCQQQTTTTPEVTTTTPEVTTTTTTQAPTTTCNPLTTAPQAPPCGDCRTCRRTSEADPTQGTCEPLVCGSPCLVCDPVTRQNDRPVCVSCGQAGLTCSGGTCAECGVTCSGGQVLNPANCSCVTSCPPNTEACNGRCYEAPCGGGAFDFARCRCAEDPVVTTTTTPQVTTTTTGAPVCTNTCVEPREPSTCACSCDPGGTGLTTPCGTTTADNPCICATDTNGDRVCAAHGACGGAIPCNTNADCAGPITGAFPGDVGPGFCHANSCTPPMGFAGRCVPYCL